MPLPPTLTSTPKPKTNNYNNTGTYTNSGTNPIPTLTLTPTHPDTGSDIAIDTDTDSDSSSDSSPIATIHFRHIAPPCLTTLYQNPKMLERPQIAHFTLNSPCLTFFNFNNHLSINHFHFN